MKPLLGIITCLMLSLFINKLYSQDAVEVPAQEYSKVYLTEIAKINETEAKNPQKAIQLLENLLKKNIKPFEEYDILCFRLPSLYAAQNKYDQCLINWNKALDKGYFFLIVPGENPFPEYLNKIQDKEMLQKILTKNSQLKDKLTGKTRPEYFVKVPEKYSSEKKYPLILVFHGGYGSHIGSYENWRSPSLFAENIVVYIQGTISGGTYMWRFDPANYSKQIQDIYNQLISKYSIDTSDVVLCGPSAGGMVSVQTAMQNLIPAKGLILAFPVKPRNLDSNNVKIMAGNKIRGAIITGENDWALGGQKEMSVLFDKYGLQHRFLVFPETGHEYPQEFEKYMDSSLKYIRNKVQSKE